VREESELSQKREIFKWSGLISSQTSCWGGRRLKNIGFQARVAACRETREKKNIHDLEEGWNKVGLRGGEEENQQARNTEGARSGGEERGTKQL